MALSQWNNEVGEDLEFDARFDTWTQTDMPTTPQYTARSTAMFRKLFYSYPVCQSLLTDLSAVDVARLLRAIGGEHIIGRRERTKYLNPMRDLFSDSELSKLQYDLAGMKDHHIVIWGHDLAEFLRRVPEAFATPDEKGLDLWITELSTRRADWLVKEGSDFELGEGPWYEEDYMKTQKRRPKIGIPGEWSPLAGHYHSEGFRQPQVKGRRQERVENVRLHLHQAMETSSSPQNFAWQAVTWQISPPVMTADSPESVPGPSSWTLADTSVGISTDKQLHYMTTKDMETFHVKTVQHVAHPEQVYATVSPEERDLIVYYEVFWQMARPQGLTSVAGYMYPFILSLKDGSQDERSVETFGVDLTSA